MWWKKSFIIMPLIVTGCVTSPVSLSPVVVNPDRHFVDFNNTSGKKYIVSEGDKSTVALMQADDKDLSSYNPTFLIKVANQGRDAVRFGERSISAVQNGKSVKVMGAQQIAAALKSEQETRNALAFATVLLGSLSTGIATANPTPMSAATIATNNFATQTTINSYSSSTANAQEFGKTTAKTHLGSGSLQPGMEVSGLISAPEITDAGPVVFTVRFADEIHRISFVPRAK